MSGLKNPLTDSPAASGSNTRVLIHESITKWLRQEMGTTVDHVDYDTPLFELAIDSLGVATIAAELERKSRKSMNPDVLYELETINELADYLDSLPANSSAAAAAAAAADDATAAADSARVDFGRPEHPMAAEDAAHGVDPLAHYRRLNRRVNSLKEKGLYFFEPVISEHDGAWVTADGRRMLMLSSYEYLGLLGHPHLTASAVAAIKEFGTGHHGVRLLAGTTTVHRRLEARLAEFMKAQDAVVFSSGYVTNLSTISALVGPGDCVIGDQWNHASIVDGCRMSGAKFFEFRHNDMDSLAEELDRARGHRALVVVDAVYSMDGDVADMPTIVQLCRTHGALLMVDEAHSLGVLGKTGHGVQEHFDLDPDDIDVKMGTLSKTLASCGGFVAGREEIASYLRHHARGYIFSGALPAGQTQVAIAALDVLEQEPQLVERLWTNVEQYLSGLKSLGFDTAQSVTPIVPVMTRNEPTTLEMTRICRSEGLLVVPVAYPAVPLDAPRLRTCVSAIHSQQDVEFALDVLARAGRQCGLIA